jgi:hypothetical protein
VSAIRPLPRLFIFLRHQGRGQLAFSGSTDTAGKSPRSKRMAQNGVAVLGQGTTDVYKGRINIRVHHLPLSTDILFDTARNTRSSGESRHHP